MEILQKAYKNAKVVLATPKISTIDAMEEFSAQIMTTIEITKTLLETWENDFSQMKINFSAIFKQIEVNTT